MSEFCFRRIYHTFFYLKGKECRLFLFICCNIFSPLECYSEKARWDAIPLNGSKLHLTNKNTVSKALCLSSMTCSIKQLLNISHFFTGCHNRAFLENKLQYLQNLLIKLNQQRHDNFRLSLPFAANVSMQLPSASLNLLLVRE